jgi:catechol 2,3-dioxygenase-like lactoylglutathione lyase family enzyme
MITRLSHATVYVQDYDQALEFYTQKLGFEVRQDVKMDGGFRWLTVAPKSQPDLEIILYEPQATGRMDEATANQIRALVQRGALGAGVFDTDDCRKTYEELKGKGVEFVSPPKEQGYGVEAIFKDNSGNWFSLTQRPQQ